MNSKAIQELNEKVERIERRKLVGSSVIDTSPLTEDITEIYSRLEAVEGIARTKNNNNQEISTPILHRCVEISRINELYTRINNIEIELSESKIGNESQELINSLLEKNSILENRISELESKLESLPKVESKTEIEDSDAGSLSLIESLQERLFKAEQLALKQDKMIKKLTVAVNKLLKE